MYREHCSSPYSIPHDSDLSLCIQGTRLLVVRDIRYHRFIPVHTGNTICWLNLQLTIAVYPCAYREHSNGAVKKTGDTGLSLCIQGTPQPTESPILAIRFIPVHTGNTPSATAPPDTIAVYPCAYREHLPLAITINLFCGLSLCIQGTPTYATCCCGSWRFIPVHTGNTKFIAATAWGTSVYPCAYREHPNYNILFYN